MNFNITNYETIGSTVNVLMYINSTELWKAWQGLEQSPDAADVLFTTLLQLMMNPQKVCLSHHYLFLFLMVPAHFHDAAGDLFTIMKKFWDCPKFWQCSCHIVVCSLNSCYIRVVFSIFHSLLLYFVLGS